MPNAGHQARRAAGAERTLSAVACMPWLGAGLGHSALERDFGFTEAQIARIHMALGTWASFGADADRRWLEPLLRDLVSGDSE
jgi:hypothetical protein